MRNLTAKHAILAVSLVAFAPLAPADNGETELDDAQLESFLMARANVQRIQAEYSSRLQAAQDGEKVAQLQQEAQQKMVEAVRAEDLTVEEFKRIANEARRNPELGERLQEIAE